MTRTARPATDPGRGRPARPEDAPGISELYTRTYTPAGGGDPGEVYPFPQLMDPAAVAEMVAGGEIAWVVSEGPGGEVVGSAAAVRNIGGDDDRIAEVFGVAVEGSLHRSGIGTALLRRLVTELGDSAAFLLCEARTAEAGGWKVARNAEFLPVGFEPYAHAMPVGYESMVLTGRRGSPWRGSWGPQGGRRASGATEPVLRLAEAVWPREEDDREVSPGADGTASLTAPGTLRAEVPGEAAIEVRRGSRSAVSWFATPAGQVDRSSGVVGLRPLQGVDRSGRRFEQNTFVISSGHRVLGAARVVLDRIDRRARVLGLRLRDESARRAALSGVVHDLLNRMSGGHLIILIWVQAHDLRLQAELEFLGFLPTAYLPGMIASPQGRADVVQYTRLDGRSYRESRGGVTAVDWPEARTVIEQVIQEAETHFPPGRSPPSPGRASSTTSS